MAMPTGETVSYNMEDIAGLTQTLNNLLDAYNQANNNFITVMKAILGTPSFSGKAATAADEISSILNESQTTANEKFSELITNITNAAEATGNADAASAQAFPG